MFIWEKMLLNSTIDISILKTIFIFKLIEFKENKYDIYDLVLELFVYYEYLHIHR